MSGFAVQIGRREESKKERREDGRKDESCKSDAICFWFSGVAAVIEYAVRQGGRQNKISSLLSRDICDIMREATYW